MIQSDIDLDKCYTMKCRIQPAFIATFSPIVSGASEWGLELAWCPACWSRYEEISSKSRRWTGAPLATEQDFWEEFGK